MKDTGRLPEKTINVMHHPQQSYLNVKNPALSSRDELAKHPFLQTVAPSRWRLAFDAGKLRFK